MPIRTLTQDLVREIIDSHGQITKLNLSNNEISWIENLEQLTCLTKLNLSCNRLGREPECLGGVTPLVRLRELDVSGNAITSLEPFSTAAVCLERLDAANNAIAHVDEVSYLTSLTALTELVLTGNPMAIEDAYRSHTLDTLYSLHTLDHIPRKYHHQRHANIGELQSPAVGERSHLEMADRRDGGSKQMQAKSTSSTHCGSDARDRKEESVDALPLPSGYSDTGEIENRIWQSRQDDERGRANDEVDDSLSTEDRGASDRGIDRPILAAESAKAFGREQELGQLASPTSPKSSEMKGSCECPGAVEDEPLTSSRMVGERVVSANPTKIEAPSYSHETSKHLPESVGERVPGINEAGDDMGNVLSTARPAVFVAVQELLPVASLRDKNTFEGDHGASRTQQAEQVQELVQGAVAPNDEGVRVSDLDSALGSSLKLRHRFAAVPLPADLPAKISSASSLEWNNVSASFFRDGRRVKAVVTAEEKDGEQNRLFANGSGTPIRRAVDVSNDTEDCHIAGRATAPDMSSRQAVDIANFEHHQEPNVNIASSTRQQKSSHAGDSRPRSTSRPVFDRSDVGMRASLRSRWEIIERRESTRRDAAVSRGVRKGKEACLSSGADGVGAVGSGQTITIERSQWEATKQEMESLRRQAELNDTRCSALSEMQRLTEATLARDHVSSFAPFRSQPSYSKHNQPQNDTRGRSLAKSSASTKSTSKKSLNMSAGSKHENRFREYSVDSSEHGDGGDDEEKNDEKEAKAHVVSKLLACWRGEVLKLLLQKGAAAETAAEDSRRAARQVLEEQESRVRAELDAQSLAQRALAAEAEAELLSLKLTHALNDLQDNRTRRCAAEATGAGYTQATRSLRVWVQGFVARASEGFFEREALLARGVAKLEAFSERVGQAAGRLQMLETLLQHKEIQLRNSRAALAADRRVWLLERRDREIAALSAAGSPPKLLDRETPRDERNRTSDRPLEVASRGTRPRGVYGAGGAAVTPAPLLEGLRPECEAVMRALFCRVDRLGTGAVQARRLLSVLRSDCGVTELMEAAVGADRWAAALLSMERSLCPNPVRHDNEALSERGDGAAAERDVTWGEFLLFFLPSVGPADDAYNAGLVSGADGYNLNGSDGNIANVDGYGNDAHRQDHSGAPESLSLADISARPDSSVSTRTETGEQDMSNRSQSLADDAVAMLQMVVPSNWSAGGGCVVGDVLEPGSKLRGGFRREGGLAALSVSQVRGEVLRLANERGYLLSLLRKDGRVGRRRAVAVHDQYRHELRALHAKIRESESSLEQATRRFNAEAERTSDMENDIAQIREEMAHSEQEWRRRLDMASKEKDSALSESSKEAKQAATTARERISRLEAEHALALRENGKASVRQRALERELARIKNSLETEARVEKQALEERIQAGDSKLAVARRERNALLAALRDVQRQDRVRSNPLPASTPPIRSTSRAGDDDNHIETFGTVGESDGGHRDDALGEPSVSTFVAAVDKDGRDKSFHDSTIDASATLSQSGGGVALDWSTGQNKSTGVVSGGGVSKSAKAASLSARLEMLAVQTQQLLAGGSDTPRSSDSDDDEFDLN